MKRLELLGLPIDALTLSEAVEAALGRIERGEGGYVVTPNPEMLLAARENARLREAIEGAALSLPDGVGLLYAAKLLGKPLSGRVPGVDFASSLMARLSEKGGSVYLLGARPGVAEEAAGRLKAEHPGLQVLGWRDGYFSEAEEEGLVGELAALSPQLLLVCLGSPKQELFMQTYSARLPRCLMAGLGGSLDVYAGRVRRAPPAWRRLGLEWLYRVLREPKRLGRVVKLPGLLWLAIKERGREKASWPREN